MPHQRTYSVLHFIAKYLPQDVSQIEFLKTVSVLFKGSVMVPLPVGLSCCLKKFLLIVIFEGHQIIKSIWTDTRGCSICDISWIFDGNPWAICSEHLFGIKELGPVVANPFSCSEVELATDFQLWHWSWLNFFQVDDTTEMYHDCQSYYYVWKVVFVKEQRRQQSLTLPYKSFPLANSCHEFVSTEGCHGLLSFHYNDRCYWYYRSGFTFHWGYTGSNFLSLSRGKSNLQHTANCDALSYLISF